MRIALEHEVLKEVLRVLGVVGLTEPTPVFVIGEREIHVTASVGIAVYPEDGQDIDALLNNADTAMYRAKEEGRDSYSLYAPAMSAPSVDPPVEVLVTK